MEPTLTFTAGGSKNKRRSSIGRRVSISATVKVKQFRPDERDFTLWNSTYEEERSNLNSDSSSAHTKSDDDDDVFINKTMVDNEDMEETEMISGPSVLSSLHEKFGSKSDTSILNPASSSSKSNKTIANIEDMEETRVIPKTPNVMMSLQEKFGSRNETMSKTMVQDIEMEMTQDVRTLQAKSTEKSTNDKTMVGNDDMEETRIIPTTPNVMLSLQEKFGVKNTKNDAPGNDCDKTTKSKNNRTLISEQDMEETNVLPNIHKKSHQNDNKTILQDDGMEETQIVSKIPNVHVPTQKIESNESDKSGSSKNNLTIANVEDMEETRVIPKTPNVMMSLQEKFGSRNETLSKTMVQDTEMEMTQDARSVLAKLSDNEQSETNNDKTTINDDDMEETRAIPASSHVMLSLQNQFGNDTGSKNNKTMISEQDMEETSVLPKLQKKTFQEDNKTILRDDDGMEETNIGSKIPNIQMSTQENESIEHLKDMEETSVLPNIQKKACQNNNKTILLDDGMEETQIVSKSTNIQMLTKKNESSDYHKRIQDENEKCDQVQNGHEEERTSQNKTMISEQDMEETNVLPHIQKESNQDDHKTKLQDDAMEETQIVSKMTEIQRSIQLNEPYEDHHNVKDKNDEVCDQVPCMEIRNDEERTDKNKMLISEKDMEESNVMPKFHRKSYQEDQAVVQQDDVMEVIETGPETLDTQMPTNESESTETLQVHEDKNDEMCGQIKNVETEYIDENTNENKVLHLDMDESHALPEIPTKSYQEEHTLVQQDDVMEVSQVVSKISAQENESTENHEFVKDDNVETCGRVENEESDSNKSQNGPKESHIEANSKVIESKNDEYVEDDSEIVISSRKTSAIGKESDKSVRDNKSMTREMDKTANATLMEISDSLDEYEQKSQEMTSYISGLKRFLDNLESSPDMTDSELEPPPAKRAKFPEIVSIFQYMVQNQGPKKDLGYWTLKTESDSSAIFGFFMETWQIQLTLGHSLPMESGKNVKNWAIRKAQFVIKNHENAENSIRLADFLLAKEWTNERLAHVFKSTRNLHKSLAEFGASVNKALIFVQDLDEIAGNHCKFDIDMNDMKVRTEFFSMKKMYAFATEISFFAGFKQAKYENSKLIPLKSNRYVLNQEKFKKIVYSRPSGWSFLKKITNDIDEYVRGTEIYE